MRTLDQCILDIEGQPGWFLLALSWRVRGDWKGYLARIYRGDGSGYYAETFDHEAGTAKAALSGAIDKVLATQVAPPLFDPLVGPKDQEAAAKELRRQGELARQKMPAPVGRLLAPPPPPKPLPEEIETEIDMDDLI